MELPLINTAELLNEGTNRVLISAYGFEGRSLGWSGIQLNQRRKIINDAYIIKYEPAKAKNKILELCENLMSLGVSYPKEIIFNYLEPDSFEKTLEIQFRDFKKYDEVIFDITAMTKYLILLCLCKLNDFKGTLRIVYSEAENYSPSREEFENYKINSSQVAHFPNQGFKKILRAKCLSSIRMQGQPVALIAFTSFNEQLVRAMLGTINPYRLLFINGVPPRKDFEWRELATQEIHKRLIADYKSGNEFDTATGGLKRRSSTLFYHETIDRIDEIYKEFGLFERIIIAATGSKMQTVGLFFSKIKHQDIHIEYPTPDSYFFAGMSNGVRNVHEIKIEHFSDFINEMQK